MYIEMEDRAKAELLLTQSLQLAQTINSEYSLPYDLAMEIGTGYVKLGQKAKAEPLFFQAEKQILCGVFSSLFCSLESSYLPKVVASYGEIELKTKANELLAKVLEIANIPENQIENEIVDKNKFSYTDKQTLSNVAIAYSTIGQCNRAIEVAKSIKDKDLSPESQIFGYIMSAFTDIAINCAKAEQYDRAIQAVEEIEDYYKNEALNEIAIEYIKKRHYTQALKFIKDRDYSKIDRAEVLIEIAERVVQIESTATAKQLLEQTLLVAETIERIDKRNNALRAIAAQYATLGQQNKSERELNKALNIADTIHYDEYKVLALSAISTQYATFGQQEQAENLLAEALEITDNLPDKAKTEMARRYFCRDWKWFYPLCWNSRQAEVRDRVIEFD